MNKEKISIFVGIPVFVFLIVASLSYLDYKNTRTEGNVGISYTVEFCSITWNLSQITIHPKQIEQYAREKIGKIAYVDTLPEREIKIENIDSGTISLTVEGFWHLTNEDERPNLEKAFSKLKGVEVDKEILISCTSRWN